MPLEGNHRQLVTLSCRFVIWLSIAGFGIAKFHLEAASHHSQVNTFSQIHEIANIT
jgi:hypothetical protein